MDKMTAVFRALSDRNRLRVLSMLMKHDELCACHLTLLTGVTGATISRHVDVLISSGLVVSRKSGRWVHYRLQREGAEFGEILDWIERRLEGDVQAARDARTLQQILSCPPDGPCRTLMTSGENV